jgi:hypothetical protein
MGWGIDPYEPASGEDAAHAMRRGQHMADIQLIERVPEDFPFETTAQVGAGMMVTGIIGFVIGLVRGDRGALTRTASTAILVFGFALTAGTMLLQRQVKIESAEDAVLAELERLDPIARAQVLKTVADEQLKDFKGE